MQDAKNPAPTSLKAAVGPWKSSRNHKLCSEEVRLPLVKVTDQTKKVVKSAMAHASLI